MKCGISDITNIKQKNFTEYLKLYSKIIPSIIKKFNGSAWECFFFFDMNAGPGGYIKNGIDIDINYRGSPIIFLDEIKNYNYQTRYIFIEKDKNIYNNLIKYIYNNYSKNYFDIACIGESNELKFNNKNTNHKGIIANIDNRNAIKELIKNQPNIKNKKCFGFIYTDPNGIFDTEMLKDISNIPCFQFMDILINCNGTAIKRCTGAFGTENLNIKLRTINKKHWKIRIPFGKWQWSLLWGTNWKNFPAIKGMGFYDINSIEGQQIFQKLNTMERG